MKCFVALSLISSLLSFSVLAAQHVETIDSCSTDLQAHGGAQKYRTLLTRRSVACTVTVTSNSENAIKVDFYNLRKACDLKPESVVILEENSDPVFMCDSELAVFLSDHPKIVIQYFTSTGIEFEVSEMRNQIACKETLDYSYYGRSLTLTSISPNETCFVAFPGRTIVVMEEVRLESDDCKSHVDIMTGRDFFTYTYRLKQYCRAENGETDSETLVICPRGLLLFKSASAAPETIRFRLEIPLEDRPLLVHNLEC